MSEDLCRKLSLWRIKTHQCTPPVGEAVKCALLILHSCYAAIFEVAEVRDEFGSEPRKLLPEVIYGILAIIGLIRDDPDVGHEGRSACKDT